MRFVVCCMLLVACGGASKDTTPQADRGGESARGTTNAPAIADPAVAVSAGIGHICALRQSGAAYCWGMNSGALGSGRDSEKETTPVPVSGQHVFKAIAAGAGFTCGVDVVGRGWCWGGGTREDGQQGAGGLRDSSVVPISIRGEHRFSALGASMHTCGLDADGAVWCWGANGVGQIDSTGRAVPAPRLMVAPERFTAIAVGGNGACALSTAGSVRCWGGTNGRMAGVATLPAKARSVAAGCAVLDDESTWCWSEPGNAARVATEQKFASITANHDQRCGITADGAAYCWGRNIDGWLGVTPETSCTRDGQTFQCNNSPAPLKGGIRFRQISLSSTFAAGVATDGRVYWWGTDPSELGAPVTVPTEVKLP
jgi:hypothetical protein